MRPPVASFDPAQWRKDRAAAKRREAVMSRADLAPSVDIVDRSGPVHKFAASDIQAQVDKALSTLGTNKVVATVVYESLDKTLRFAAAANLGDGWSVIGTLAHRPGETYAAGQVAWSK